MHPESQLHAIWEVQLYLFSLCSTERGTRVELRVHQPYPAQRSQYVTSRKSSFSQLWAELFLFSLLSMSPSSNSGPPVFLQRPASPTCNPCGWVRLIPDPSPREGHKSQTWATSALHLLFLLREYVKGCDTIFPGTSRKEGTSHSSWTVETFTNLEAGTGIDSLLLSALRFGSCPA